MKKEFNLSDKMEEVEDRKGFEYGVIPTEYVKEFIKKLKEESKHIKICDKVEIKGKQIVLTEDLCSVKDVELFLKKIDKLAGKELI